MNVLIVGSGGREHALAWKVAQSPQIDHLWVAPGNAGTATMGKPGGNVAIAADDIAGLLDFVQANRVDLTIVGPEVPLAAGLVDMFQAHGQAVFGPTRAAAQLESSKAFAKAFMERHNIPTARHATFSDFDAALAHVQSVSYPIVIKASGLAAGKGVLLPERVEEAEAALREILVERSFGDAGDRVVIEERLSGPEVSMLAFSDGETVAVMPAAQDHKRAFEGDQGPNTGGMGAFAPSPLATAELITDVYQTILQPTVDGMRAEGMPYIGVLYAGLMLTDDGPKVLEFNCRFGDPETQVILPLLETDLLDAIQACVECRLAETSITWENRSAATVVLASGGYPGAYRKGLPIAGLDVAGEMSDVILFHAGTEQQESQIVTSGGRVLNVTATGTDLKGALTRAYTAVECVQFEGMYYRRDIGASAQRVSE